MDWKDYAETARRYRERFGRMPPTILTEEGTLDVMKDALAEEQPVKGGAAKPDDSSRH
jgi:hypothetical protein